MNFCEKCYEKHWAYKHIDGYIIATCNLCGHEVEFLDRKTKKQLFKKNKNVDISIVNKNKQ